MKYAGALLAASFIALSGCAAQTPYEKYKAGEALTNFPYKAGTNLPQQQRAITDCMISAAQRVPQNISIQTTPIYTTPTQTQCNRIGTQTFCNTSGGNTMGGQTYSTDANAGLRVRAYAQCMVDKGYQFVSIPACPVGTTAAHLDKAKVLLPRSRNTCYFVTPDGQNRIGNLGE